MKTTQLYFIVFYLLLPEQKYLFRGQLHEAHLILRYKCIKLFANLAISLASSFSSANINAESLKSSCIGSTSKLPPKRFSSQRGLYVYELKSFGISCVGIGIFFVNRFKNFLSVSQSFCSPSTDDIQSRFSAFDFPPLDSTVAKLCCAMDK